MKQKRKVYVCTSHRPRQFGGGCCSDKGSEKIAALLKDQIAQEGLAQKVEVIQVDCLRRCLQGVSIQVMPDNVGYGKMRQEHVPSFVAEHLIKGKPLKDLLIEPVIVAD